MKNFVLSFFASTILSFGLIAQGVVNIPDSNFKAALLSYSPAIDINPMDGEIDSAEAALITFLDLTNRNIDSLDGIGAFINLTQLRCSQNHLTSLDMSNNLLIDFLLCDYNQLSTINIDVNTSLTNFGCEGNQLTNLDISNNTLLTSLVCSANTLDTLDISNNSMLTTLYCGSNLLTNLDVSNNLALTFLLCAINQLDTLDVTNNSLLRFLNCTAAGISSLDLTQNDSITSLRCSNNQLSNLDLSNNSKLTYLNCNSNDLYSLNVRNGNNTNMTFFEALNNSDLNCLMVDDSIYSTTNWSSGVDAGVTFDCPTVGIDELSQQDELILYPNPVNNKLIIEFSDLSVIQTAEIMTLDGKVVKRSNQFSNSISVLNLESGVYILRIQGDNGLVRIRKFVKE